MPEVFKYCAESHFQHLRIRLVENDLNTSNTPTIQVMSGVTIVLSGTSPCFVVEINCADISVILADTEQKALFARICGPDIYRFLEANHFYFNFNNYCSLTLEDVKGWQIMWLSIQNDIFLKLGRKAVVLLEDEHSLIVDEGCENIDNSKNITSTGNVIQLFDRK